MTVCPCVRSTSSKTMQCPANSSRPSTSTTTGDGLAADHDPETKKKKYVMNAVASSDDSEGRARSTDSNAARIHQQCWDSELLELLSVPESLLPEVLDCAADFGTTHKDVLGSRIPIAGVAGDQQAALVGQACFEPGMIKSTYGTGCFMILNTGEQALVSNNKLLTTVGYRLNDKTTYALEGSIFVAGAAVQWLRDGLGIIDSAEQTEALAASLDSNHGVYLVPAFTGLLPERGSGRQRSRAGLDHGLSTAD